MPRREFNYFYILAILGIITTFVIFFAVRDLISAKTKENFVLKSSQHVSFIREELRNDLSVMDAMAAFYDASDLVTPEEFEIFSKAIFENVSSIRALEWVPKVPAKQKEEFLKEFKRVHGDFVRITERDKDGRLREASARPFYYPIYFVEPRFGNELAIGFDLGSDARRLQTLQEALQASDTVLTEQVKLVQNRGEKGTAFLAIRPIYKQAIVDVNEGLGAQHILFKVIEMSHSSPALKGFVVGVYEILEILDHALSKVPPEERLNVRLYEGSPSEEFLIYEVEHPSPAHIGWLNKLLRIATSLDASAIQYRDEIKIKNRTWTVTVHPNSRMLIPETMWVPFAVIPLGLIATAFLIYILNAEQKKRHYLEKINNQKEENERKLITMNHKLETLTVTDPLTGCLNRRGFDIELKRHISLLKRGKKAIVVMADIDDFKDVNENFSYAIGDILLRDVAEKIKGSLRPADYVARIGGDEFLILLPDCEQADGSVVVERVRSAIAVTPLQSEAKNLNISASFGLIALEEQWKSVDDILRNIHRYVKQSKKSGKNTVTSKEQEPPPTDSQMIYNEIIQLAESENTLKIAKQGIWDINRHKAVHFEYLCRFTQGNKFRNPVTFFRLSRTHNLLTFADMTCIKKTLDLIKRMDYERTTMHHINIFPSTLHDIEIEELIGEVSGRKIPFENICFELSEQQVIGNPKNLSGRIDTLKSLGVKIAMDDIGYGNTSLENLLVLEPQIAKIDKAKVTGAHQDIVKMLSLERLVSLLKALNVVICAEGIETKEDLELVKKLKIPLAQGYYLDRPEEVRF